MVPLHELGSEALRLNGFRWHPTTLRALAHESFDPFAHRHDPGCALAVARLGFNAAPREQWRRELLQGVLADWDDPLSVALPIDSPAGAAALATGDRLAFLAEELTALVPDADAVVVGLLARVVPLGWYALAASEAVSLVHEPNVAEVIGIARRLGRKWNLPPAVLAVVGYLHLPGDVAERLGADEPLFHIIQAAAGLMHKEPNVYPLLPDDVVAAEALRRLNITPALAASIRAKKMPVAPRLIADTGQPTLLRDLLEQALRFADRRIDGNSARLEREVEELHRLLAQQKAGEAERIRSAKLSALAELAAGAGHEINNPLAVISGHSQYLLPGETSNERQRALQSIIRQTHRIHQILNELMQFARPAEPQLQPLEVDVLICEVFNDLQELAEAKQVSLEFSEADQPVPLVGDARQLHMALSCLVRNGIEAAPASGWVRVRLETPQPGLLAIVVEDSGNGPSPAQMEHLFDPFWSGRSAGRGRGLGLPTAWRLAREHGGDVRFVPLPGGPTRFVLSLPLVPQSEEPPYRCAA